AARRTKQVREKWKPPDEVVHQNEREGSGRNLSARDRRQPPHRSEEFPEQSQRGQDIALFRLPGNVPISKSVHSDHHTATRQRPRSAWWRKTKPTKKSLGSENHPSRENTVVQRRSGEERPPNGWGLRRCMGYSPTSIPRARPGNAERFVKLVTVLGGT